MPKYYIETNSFAAPFFSDAGFKYVDAETPEAALEAVVRSYEHPAGLYAAVAYSSADAKNLREEPLARWLCNVEAEKQRLTKDLGCYSYMGVAPGKFEIDGELHVVANPHEGHIVLRAHTDA